MKRSLILMGGKTYVVSASGGMDQEARIIERAGT